MKVDVERVIRENPELAMTTFSDRFCDANHGLCAKTVARLSGCNHRTLSGYGSDHGGGTHTLDAVMRSVCAQALLGDPRVLDAMASACGRVMYVVPRIKGRVTQDLVREIASESTALAVQVGAIADAFTDGEITPKELELVQKCTRELIATAVQVLSLVEAHARRGDLDSEKNGKRRASKTRRGGGGQTHEELDPITLAFCAGTPVRRSSGAGAGRGMKPTKRSAPG